jgi:hypothetical protein
LQRGSGRIIIIIIIIIIVVRRLIASLALREKSIIHAGVLIAAPVSSVGGLLAPPSRYVGPNSAAAVAKRLF